MGVNVARDGDGGSGGKWDHWYGWGVLQLCSMIAREGFESWW